MRAKMSAAPPGAKVLTMRTGRAGQSCADAGAATMKAPARAKSARRFMCPPPARVPAAASIGAREMPNSNPEFAPFAPLGDVEEQLVEWKSPLDQALLVRIGHEPLEILGVAFRQSVFPGVRAQDALLLFPPLAIPSERDDTRILHPFHGERLGFVESLVQ